MKCRDPQCLARLLGAEIGARACEHIDEWGFESHAMFRAHLGDAVDHDPELRAQTIAGLFLYLSELVGLHRCSDEICVPHADAAIVQILTDGPYEATEESRALQADLLRLLQPAAETLPLRTLARSVSSTLAAVAGTALVGPEASVGDVLRAAQEYRAAALHPAPKQERN